MNSFPAIVKLALRNLSRNRRRTLLTAASVAFAVLFATLLQGMQRGIWDNIFESAIRMQTGHLQIQDARYENEPSLDWSFSPDSVRLKDARISMKLPRISTFVLGSGEEKTRGLMLICGDLALEDRLSGLGKRIVDGNFPGSQEILLGIGAAHFLGVDVGDTLVVLGQGFRGSNAAALLRISGLMDFNLAEINDRMAYAQLETGDRLFNMEGRITQLLIEPSNRNQVATLKKVAQSQLDSSLFAVLDWKEMLPDLIEARKMDDGGTRITQGILYAIVAFGIFGTLLMMVKEREFESGVLLAIGMRRGFLAAVIWVETLLIASLGAFFGLILALGPIWYFHVHPFRLTGDMAKAYENFGMEPVLPTSMEPWVFISHFLVVLGIVTLLSFMPVRKIFTLNPVKAMRK